jgi:hypothetical protein
VYDPSTFFGGNTDDPVLFLTSGQENPPGRCPVRGSERRTTLANRHGPESLDVPELLKAVDIAATIITITP